MLSARPRSLRLLFLRQVTRGVNDDRQRPFDCGLLLDFLEQLDARHVGQAEVEHHAIEVLVSGAPPAPPCPLPTAVVFTSPLPISCVMCSRCDFVVLDQQKILHGPFDEVLQLVEGLLERFIVLRLREITQGACVTAGCGSSSTVMMCTGMCRVARSISSRSNTRQPSKSGRCMSSVMASGLSSRARARAAAPRGATTPLNPFSWASSSSTLA